MIFVCDRVENMVGKGENAVIQHFLLFLPCLPNVFLIVFKTQNCIMHGGVKTHLPHGQKTKTQDSYGKIDNYLHL